jgi:hypothetical protein
LVQSNFDHEKIFLQFHIDAIDRQIDQLVQELYQLIARCSTCCDNENTFPLVRDKEILIPRVDSVTFCLKGFEGKSDLTRILLQYIKIIK